jgi:23S rRNA (uridine2552-2'-O)-methyltransferase
VEGEIRRAIKRGCEYALFKEGMMAYNRKDHYYKRAKEQGKASRAAFKLDQIQKKYKIVEKGHTVLDLGSAPGGWFEELGKMVGKKGFVLGVDKLPLRIYPSENMLFYLGDLEAEDAIEQLRFRLLSDTVDSVVSDMSPNLSGIAFRDTYKSYELADRAFGICSELLREGGNFVVKIFPGKETTAFKKRLEKYFKKVHMVVPPATRRTSSEQYIVARGFKIK